MGEDWARKILINSFKRKIDITVKKIIKESGFSLSDFYNKWQAELSPKRFLTLFRLIKALKLLSYNDRKIKDIADELKFCDHFYFCKWFKKLTGITPKKFQMRYGYYFRKRLYQRIKLKNFDIKNIFWISKILENE